MSTPDDDTPQTDGPPSSPPSEVEDGASGVAVGVGGRQASSESSEPTDSEPNDSEPNDSEPNDSEPNDSEPSDSEPSDSDPSSSAGASSEAPAGHASRRGRERRAAARRSEKRPLVREVRFGWPAAAVGFWSVVHWLVMAAGLAPFVVFGVTAGEATPVYGTLAAAAPSVLLTLVFSAFLARRIRNVANGTTGRARLVVLNTGAVLRALGFAAFAGIVAYALTAPDALAMGWYGEDALPIGELPSGAESLRLAMTSQGTWVLFIVSAVVLGVGLLLEWVGAIACWFLLPVGVRAVAFYVVDALLLFAFVVVTLLLPIRPDEMGDAALPAGRLVTTTFAVFRLIVRLLPLILDAIEDAALRRARWFMLPFFAVILAAFPAVFGVYTRVDWALPVYFFAVVVGILMVVGARAGGMRALLAARMMRARKSGFLNAIGLLSILAVSFSSCTLTTTLSVMGGFRNDLKRKILGNNAHVVVDQERGTFEGWSPTLEATRGTEGVLAATPYVQGEVMITSATNLAGAVIRGIDPDTIGDVTELPRNLRHGQMEYLSNPEALLDLRADEMAQGLLLPPPSSIDALPPPPGPEGDRGSLFDDVERALDDGTGAPDDGTGTPDDGTGTPDDGTGTPDDGTGTPESDALDRALEEALAEDAPTPDGADEGEAVARIERDIGEFLLPEDAPPPPTEPPPGFGAGGGSNEDVLPGLIVGQELARTLRLHVGDEVNVVSPRGDLGPAGPMPRTRPFRVAGIFYSGMYEFDMKMAYTTLEAGQRFLNVGDAISGIEIKVEDTDDAEPIARAVETSVARDELRVRAWQEVNRNLFGALQLEKLAMFITLGIAILVASFCIVGTLTLLVQEKGKEVGILKAMGATGEQIVALFMAQGLMIGLLGALIGLGLGFVTCFAAEHYGVHLNPEVYYIDKLPVHVEASEFVLTGIASVLVCLLATIYPAILGSRLRPVEALRYS